MRKQVLYTWLMDWEVKNEHIAGSSLFVSKKQCVESARKHVDFITTDKDDLPITIYQVTPVAEVKE